MIQQAKPSERELEDLILLALAKREQMSADETLQPLPKPEESQRFTGNIRRIAEFEGWNCNSDEVDAAVQRLIDLRLMVTDGDPRKPGIHGRSARLQPSGYARAVAVSRKYLGKPLQAFQKDSTFEENGFGQIQVDFLGKRTTIGCPEGEEDLTIQFAHRFEVYTGEVLKAVPGIDEQRAMLMAGVLSQQRVDELETQVKREIPAADRLVGLDHNSQQYQEAVAAVDHLVRLVRDNNFYKETDPDDHDRRLSELEAGRRLLGGKRLSIQAIKSALVGTVVYLAAKFADAPIGEAATFAWHALKSLLHL
jgi:cell division protein ZapA (FtsZ GTPase activity inhibitor)